MIEKAIKDYLELSTGPLQVARCPSCNAWDYALQGRPGTPTGPEPGVYNCEECGTPFEIEGEP